jgi:hypothetical protein
MTFSIRSLAILLGLAFFTQTHAGKPQNSPPIVSITAPVSGASYTAPASITMSANASDSDGTIAKVDFYNGSTLLRSVTAAPYTFTWTNVANGSYSLFAKATDNAGATATSANVSVSVGTTSGNGISISSPATNSTILGGGTIGVSGSFQGAADTTIIVSNGENDAVLATINGSNFSAPSLPIGHGAYTIKATAVRRDGTTASATSNVYIAATPLAMLLAPANGKTFNQPLNLTFEAAALSPNGQIAQVSYYRTDSPTRIGTATVPPYAVTWNDVPRGSFNIYAVAEDTRGFSTPTDTVLINVIGPNVAPTVSLTSPINGASITSGATVQLAATANDSDGSIAQVEFFANSALLGASNIAPYSMPWVTPAAGDYVLVARARDNSGAATNSLPISVKVQPPNAPPTVALTSPQESASFPLGTPVPLAATASDSDGGIARVDFYQGTNLLGSSSAPPFAFNWSNASAGSYILTARAYDNLGAATTSSPVQVSVLPPPPVTVVAPLDNAKVVTPGTVLVTVRAYSANGTVSRIELFDGAELLTSFTPPGQFQLYEFNFNWSFTSPGAHTLTAKVTDSTNSISTSPVVNVLAAAAPEVRISAGGSYYIAPAYIDLYGAANAASGATIARVEFLNGQTAIASTEAAPYNITWRSVPAGTHDIALRATDSAGTSANSAPVKVVVGNAPSIEVAGGIDGSTVADDRIRIEGNFLAPPNSAVKVNGILATQTERGTYFVNAVPLSEGSNVIVASVTTMDGQTASRTVTVTRNGSPQFSLTATRPYAISSLSTGFQLENIAAVDVGRIDLSCADGLIDPQTYASIEDINSTDCVYGTPGEYKARVTVYDKGMTQVYTHIQSLYVASPQEVTRTVRSVYTTLLGRLMDGNTNAALNAIALGSRQQFSNIFSAIGNGLLSAVEQFGQIREFSVSENTATILITRDTPTGKKAFHIHLYRGHDGIWRIESM